MKNCAKKLVPPGLGNAYYPRNLLILVSAGRDMLPRYQFLYKPYLYKINNDPRKSCTFPLWLIRPLDAKKRHEFDLKSLEGYIRKLHQDLLLYLLFANLARSSTLPRISHRIRSLLASDSPTDHSRAAPGKSLQSIYKLP